MVRTTQEVTQIPSLRPADFRQMRVGTFTRRNLQQNRGKCILIRTVASVEADFPP